MSKLILPDFQNEAVQKYGIPQLYSYNPDWFRDMPADEKPVIAYADQPLDTSGKLYDVVPGWNFINNSDQYTAGGSHGKTWAASLAALTPEAFSIMPLQIATTLTATERRMMEAVRYAARKKVLAVNTSFGKPTDALVAYLVNDELAPNEVFWLCPDGYWPAKMIDFPERCDTRWIISTGALNTNGTPKSKGGSYCMFFAYAPSVSGASAKPGSVMALLKTIDPSLSQLDLRRLLIAGAQMTPEIEGKCQHGIINHLGSVEALLGHSLNAVTVPAPDPVVEDSDPEPEEPQPEPEPEPVGRTTVNVRHSLNAKPW